MSSLVAEDLKILKDFFGAIPTSGNQINIIVIGNTADLKEEIRILQDAVRDLIGIYPKIHLREDPVSEEEKVKFPINQEPEKPTSQDEIKSEENKMELTSDERTSTKKTYSEAEIKRRSEWMKNYQREKKAKKESITP